MPRQLDGSFWLASWPEPWCRAVGFLVETQLLRRVYGKELMFTMVVTFSVFMIGIGLVQYAFGLASKPWASPLQPA